MSDVCVPGVHVCMCGGRKWCDTCMMCDCVWLGMAVWDRVPRACVVGEWLAGVCGSCGGGGSCVHLCWCVPSGAAHRLTAGFHVAPLVREASARRASPLPSHEPHGCCHSPGAPSTVTQLHGAAAGVGAVEAGPGCAVLLSWSLEEPLVLRKVVPGAKSPSRSLSSSSCLLRDSGPRVDSSGSKFSLSRL